MCINSIIGMLVTHNPGWSEALAQTFLNRRFVCVEGNSTVWKSFPRYLLMTTSSKATAVKSICFGLTLHKGESTPS